MKTSRDLPLKSRDFNPKIQGDFQEGLGGMPSSFAPVNNNDDLPIPVLPDNEHSTSGY